jgi:hypothetical protein
MQNENGDGSEATAHLRSCFSFAKVSWFKYICLINACSRGPGSVATLAFLNTMVTR